MGGIETSGRGVEERLGGSGGCLHVEGQDGERGKSACWASSPGQCPWQEHSSEAEPWGLAGVWNASPLGGVCSMRPLPSNQENLRDTEERHGSALSQVPYCGQQSSKVFEVR